MRAVFDRIDRDGNRLLSRSEVLDAVRSDPDVQRLLGIAAYHDGSLYKVAFEAAFQGMDTNDSRNVSYAEFSAELHRIVNAGRSTAPRSPGRARAQSRSATSPARHGSTQHPPSQRAHLDAAAFDAAVRAVFVRIDRDGDGLLSRSELIRAVRSDGDVRKLLGFDMLPPGEQQGAFDAMFSAMDADDSCEVSYDEFAAELRRQVLGSPPPSPTRTQSRFASGLQSQRSGHPVAARRDPAFDAAVRAVFHRIDADGDGLLSRAELLRAVRTDDDVRRLVGVDARLPPAEQQRQVDAAFGAMDTNDSSNVSYDEFASELHRVLHGGDAAPARAPTGSRITPRGSWRSSWSQQQHASASPPAGWDRDAQRRSVPAHLPPSLRSPPTASQPFTAPPLPTTTGAAPLPTPRGAAEPGWECAQCCWKNDADRADCEMCDGTRSK